MHSCSLLVQQLSRCQAFTPMPTCTHPTIPRVCRKTVTTELLDVIPDPHWTELAEKVPVGAGGLGGWVGG